MICRCFQLIGFNRGLHCFTGITCTKYHIHLLGELICQSLIKCVWAIVSLNIYSLTTGMIFINCIQFKQYNCHETKVIQFQLYISRVHARTLSPGCHQDVMEIIGCDCPLVERSSSTATIWPQHQSPTLVFMRTTFPKPGSRIIAEGATFTIKLVSILQ